jgi:PIN domain nuclease of toxin-antitoxin system
MSRLLLDTHAFLWWVDDAPEISASARRVIADMNNECYLSVASCWEMAIKSSLGKLILAKGFSVLNIELRHAAKIEKLPFHHRDPFDRLLIAQAVTEKLTIVSADSGLSEYGVKVIW